MYLLRTLVCLLYLRMVIFLSQMSKVLLYFGLMDTSSVFMTLVQSVLQSFPSLLFRIRLEYNLLMSLLVYLPLNSSWKELNTSSISLFVGFSYSSIKSYTFSLSSFITESSSFFWWSTFARWVYSFDTSEDSE